MGPYIVNQKILKVLGLTQISKIRVQFNYGHNYLVFFLWSIITLLLLPSWFSSFGLKGHALIYLYINFLCSFKCYSSASTMNHGRQSSKVPFGEKELLTSSFFSFSSFTLFTPNNNTLFSFCPMFSTFEFNELNNSNSFTPTEDSSGYCDVLEDLSYAKSDTDSSNEACGDESDEEVSLEELLQDGKTKEKVEVLAAMVGLETTDPATVLNEVVRVLKVLKKINQYQLSA